MELTFLGTSSMVPTKDRNQSSLLITYKTDGILVDCGEGTQRQFKTTGIPLTKVTIILISHWHGDHVLGLPGMLQTLNSSVTGHKVKIFGPKGTKVQFDFLKKAFLMEGNERGLTMEVFDVDKERFYETSEFYIEAKLLQHSVPCLGYAVVEKDKVHIDMSSIRKLGMAEGPLLGKLQLGEEVSWKGKKVKPEDVTYTTKGRKITVIMDTELCNSAVELAQEADILVCESTYANDLEEKAEEYRHLTARQAASIANKAGAKKLVLTHFSQRYRSTKEIEEDAKTTFENVVCAWDFMKFKV